MTDKDETVAEPETTETKETTASKRRRRVPRVAMSTSLVRTVLARLIWAVCVIFALSLAITVLLIAVKASATNGLVKFDIKLSDHVDLSVFDLTNPVKDFDTSNGPPTDVRTALFNYGICAVVWLAIGRVLDRIVRP